MKLFQLFLFFFTVYLSLNYIIYADNKQVSDSQLLSEIKSKIEADKSLSGTNLNVTVEVKNQIALLTGVVNSDSEADTMIMLAESTPGVNDVDTTNLHVKKSNQLWTDVVTTAKVKGKLIQERLFGINDVTPLSVHVETNNGIVYLTGKAETRDQVENAVKVAKTVNGVKWVRYRIQLSKGDVINMD